VDSKQVSQIYKGISEWHPFNKETVKSAPEQHGIYMFRMAQSKRFGRLKGESDILYIGSTKGSRGLRGRLQQYLSPGPTQWTNRRVRAMTQKRNTEVAWCSCEEAGNLELELLHRYSEDNDELPPLNHKTESLLRKVSKTEREGVKEKVMRVLRDEDGNLISRTEG
jgi:excinuclease UvrABC nuclease subunit